MLAKVVPLYVGETYPDIKKLAGRPIFTTGFRLSLLSLVVYYCCTGTNGNHQLTCNVHDETGITHLYILQLSLVH
jgi:hypothetical protein